MPRYFEDLSFEEFQKLPRDKTLLLFPVGVFKLPKSTDTQDQIGSDIIRAKDICSQLAEKIQKNGSWTCIQMPPFTMGPKTRGYVLRDYLVDACQALAKEGFRYFAGYSGTELPKQIVAVEEIEPLLNKGLFFRLRNRRHFWCLNSPIYKGAQDNAERLEKIEMALVPFLNGQKRSGTLRSPLFWNPLHRTFFKAWLVLGGIFALVVIWVYMIVDLLGF